MPGTASMSGMMPCYPCQRGTYAEWAGARQCDPCPAGSTTQFENAISMIDCVSIGMLFKHQLCLLSFTLSSA